MFAGSARHARHLSGPHKVHAFLRTVAPACLSCMLLPALPGLVTSRSQALAVPLVPHCCRFSHPAIVIASICMLGACWSPPYYIPLPAYNLRKGGSYSAVLEGEDLVQRIPCACLCLHRCLAPASSALRAEPVQD